MSTHIAGLLLIASGAGWFVSAWLRLFRRRIRTLGSIGAFLELTQAELQTSALPLEQLLERLLPRLSEPARSFASSVRAGMAELGRRSFSEIWNAALESRLPELSEAESGALRELGSVLGRYELSRQLEAIAGCRAFLKRRESEAAAALPEKTRLALGLGLTFAALLGIVLV